MDSYKTIPTMIARVKLQMMIVHHPSYTPDELFDRFSEWVFDKLFKVNYNRFDLQYDIPDDFNSFGLDYIISILNKGG